MKPERRQQDPEPHPGESARGPDRGGAAAPRPAQLRWSSEQLLAGVREALIEHRGELYRLRCTSKGGLILTK